MDSIIGKFSNGVHYAIIPVATADVFLQKGQKRVLATLNGQVTLHGALTYREEVGHFISVGSKLVEKLGIKAGDTVNVELASDHSELQFEFPPELKAVLETDAEAKRLFESLSDGNKRGLIYLITTVKSTEKRIDRSLKIADQLKAGITSPRKMKF